MIAPNCFLFQAKKLLINENSEYPAEVDFRSAISRAYYSLYHEAYALLKTKYKHKLVSQVILTLERRNKSYNSNLVRELNERYIIELGINFHSIISQVLLGMQYQVGVDFKSFRRQRDDADYELSLIFRRNEATEIVEEIEKLIGDIKIL
jgi:uncharacterized protein (UPF0332 family)